MPCDGAEDAAVVRKRDPQVGDVARADWWPELQKGLVALYEELRSARSMPSEAPHAALLRLTRSDRAPWTGVAESERAEYLAHFGRSLDADMEVGFGRAGVLGLDGAARGSLIRLLSWDLRFLWHPSVRLLLRNAQLAGDRRLLKAVGNSVWQNERYGGRGKRSQRLLTQLLLQFRFGQPDAYADPDYRRQVHEGLLSAFHSAAVPDSDPSLNLLRSPEHFEKHLRRITENGDGRRGK